MAEHTRGPWEYHSDSRFVISPIDDGEGPLICEVTDTHEGLEGDCPAADANGHLIAAAPELLAACEGMLKHIDDVLDDEDLMQRRATLVAAVAKAKGQP